LEHEALKLGEEVFTFSQHQPDLVSGQPDNTPLEATHFDGLDLPPTVALLA
jgi:hypothetical protein